MPRDLPSRYGESSPIVFRFCVSWRLIGRKPPRSAEQIIPSHRKEKCARPQAGEKGAHSPVVGDWPKDSCSLATFPVKGHMDRLEGQNRVRALRGAQPPKWQLV
jgi:hypothetical protein